MALHKAGRHDMRVRSDAISAVPISLYAGLTLTNRSSLHRALVAKGKDRLVTDLKFSPQSSRSSSLGWPPLNSLNQSALWSCNLVSIQMLLPKMSNRLERSRMGLKKESVNTSVGQHNRDVCLL